MRHVYVHVPFCARRCSYCDFSIAVRTRVPVDEYLDALAGELSLRLGPEPAAVDRREIDTLYFGGGTPSRLGPEGVARAIGTLEGRFHLAAGAEVTLEANPDDVTPEAVRAWQAAGVNRISLGGQTFDEAALRWMHRSHGAAQTERAIELVRAGGIDDVSLDLIFAMPAEVPRDWAADVARALALAPTHLSLYGLTIEPGTPLGRWSARGDVREADEDRYAAEFLHAHAELSDAGFEHYEVSNFALPGRRARH
ncbi:MAG: coproporphyrinogen-III oxidase family protein, partial [Gemmatirosa sp.]